MANRTSSTPLLWAQSHTPRERIGREADASCFLHFGFVVGEFRNYQRRDVDLPHLDSHGRLVVLRILHDLLEAPASPELPTLAELTAGILNSDSPVTYLTDGWTDGLRRTTHLLRQFGEIVLDSAQ